ncbi:Very short patch repair protein [subsurface metagenome]
MYGLIMDNLTKEQRNLCMSRIRSKDTKPEKVLRGILTELGWKYRLHADKLPGRPDIVIPKIKTTIFVNGCFWHQHEGCKRNSMPKTNVVYWRRKLKRNVEKQKEDIKVLRKLRWKVFIIWECQTKNKDHLVNEVQRILK